MDIKPGFYTPRMRTISDDWFNGVREGAYELTKGDGKSAGRYAKSIWAFACMQERATQLASLPWQLTRNGEVVESHPIIDLLRNFGRESNWGDALSGTEIDMLNHGAGYWLIDRDRLQRVNAGTVTVEYTPSGITQFVQTIDGKVANEFARDEVVYFREFHPESDLAPGISVMEVIKRAVSIEYEAGTYLSAFLANDAVPGFMLGSDQQLPQNVILETVAWFNRKFRGPRKAGRMGVAGWGLKPYPVSSNMKDAQMIELCNQARSDICAGMRTPKILFGMTDATFANAAEARKFMVENVIIPRGEYFASVINADLVKQIDPSVKFEFNPKDLPILQEDASARWERLDKAVQRGVISEEFARDSMGWPATAAPKVQPVVQLVTSEDNALRAWFRKATKAGGDVEFITDDVDPERQGRIHARLVTAKTPADIAEAFK